MRGRMRRGHLPRQESAQSFIRKRIVRTLDAVKMHLNFYAEQILTQAHVVTRDNCTIHQVHTRKKRKNSLSPARNPDVDIPRLPDKLVRVQQGIRLPLEDERPATFRSKLLRQFARACIMLLI